MPLWHQSWDFQKNTKEWFLDCSQVRSFGDNYSSCPFCVYPATLHGNSKLILLIFRKSMLTDLIVRNACTTRRRTTTFKKSRSTISKITDLGMSRSPSATCISPCVMLTSILQDGTIPKSNPQGPASTTHAKTAWLCLLASR